MPESGRVFGVLSLVLVLGLGCGGCRSTFTDGTAGETEVVLLLHGMGRTSFSMAPLTSCLREAGYAAQPWSYSSLTTPTDELAARLRQDLERLEADPDVSQVHLVCHSFGGIVARAALLPEPPSKVHRLVLLAPPNKGSPLARKLAPYLGSWMKPLAELSDAPDSAVHRIEVVEGVEIGIVAAASDGKVPVESTHLDGETDHIVVEGFHTFLMNQSEVQRQVIHFLRRGAFDRMPP